MPVVPELEAQAPRAATPEVLVAIEQQSRLLAELLGPYADPDSESPKSTRPNAGANARRMNDLGFEMWECWAHIFIGDIVGVATAVRRRIQRNKAWQLRINAVSRKCQY